jgi:hypothetical protein
MPVTTQIDPTTGLATFLITGELTLDHVRAALEAVQSHPAYRCPGRNLVDLRRADISLTPQDLREVMALEASQSTGGRARTALVPGGGPNSDVSVLFQRYTEREDAPPLDAKVFQSCDEARRWLMGDGC